MALEAVVFPQDPLSYGCKDNCLYSMLGGGGGGSVADTSGGDWNSHDFYGFQTSEEEKNNVNAQFGAVNNNITEQSPLHANWDSSSSSPSVMQNVKDQWDSHSNSSPEPCITTVDHNQPLHGAGNFSVPPSTVEAAVSSTAPTTGRRKRRRMKSVKNNEEIENQRMTHIAVERNRRKQMNEYLAVLRSLMPPSYVQRGDQASIVGGAINFVKELEQLLQCMKGQKKTKQQEEEEQQPQENDTTTPFAEFFMFPQYSTRATHCSTVYPATSEVTMMQQNQNKSWAVADIEVSLVDSHANMKIMSKKQPGLLVKMVIGLQSLGFTILHLNITTSDDMVLTSVSVKVEEGCELNTVDEIAAAVNQLLRTVHEKAAFCADQL